MKTPNSFQKQRDRMIRRWSEEDYPGGTPRFQLGLMAKDIFVFCLIPLGSVIFFKIVESSLLTPTLPIRTKKADVRPEQYEKRSQIIHFQKASSGQAKSLFSKRAPGTLVRVRLMNVVETYSTASVHAQVIDSGLGREFMGGTLLGDASPDNDTGRIQMTFKFVRPVKRLDLAVPISARAMSLDGTIGVNATKKEGLFARAVIRSASSNTIGIDGAADSQDFKMLVARAVAAGVMQEFQSGAATAHNKAQVLALKPMTEFLVELTDFFPGQK
jgi:hypothetical protein